MSEARALLEARIKSAADADENGNGRAIADEMLGLLDAVIDAERTRHAALVVAARIAMTCCYDREAFGSCWEHDQLGAALKDEA